MAKYFTDEETAGMQDKVVAAIDYARELCGFPLVLKSGFRTKEHNEKIGGAPDSAHCAGLAADLGAPLDPTLREKMIWALCVSGFKRIESATRHIHADMDDERKPSPCFWVGVSK